MVKQMIKLYLNIADNKNYMHKLPKKKQLSLYGFEQTYLQNTQPRFSNKKKYSWLYIKLYQIGT